MHFDPQTLHKILISIMRGADGSGVAFYHVSVEQIWDPEIFIGAEEVITTNYIHGTYYPAREAFEHVDFSVNQYSREIFEAKYRDAENATGIPIGEYADIHYKIWCVRGENLTSTVWDDLVCASLDEPFRLIFMEAVGATYTED